VEGSTNRRQKTLWEEVRNGSESGSRGQASSSRKENSKVKKKEFFPVNPIRKKKRYQKSLSIVIGSGTPSKNSGPRERTRTLKWEDPKPKPAASEEKGVKETSTKRLENLKRCKKWKRRSADTTTNCPRIPEKQGKGREPCIG